MKSTQQASLKEFFKFKVSSLRGLVDAEITIVAASDGATAIATSRGDVYLLHEFQCRKIASK